MSAFEGKTGIADLLECPLMTQSGHTMRLVLVKKAQSGLS
jgi:hypothetical protein